MMSSLGMDGKLSNLQIRRGRNGSSSVALVDDSRCTFYNPAELRAIICALGVQGLGAEELLSGSQLTVRDILSENPVSGEQCSIVHRNARRLSATAPEVAIGSRLGALAFGVAGFAIMTCSRLSDVVDLLNRYGPLFNMRCELVASDIPAGLRVELRPHAKGRRTVDAGAMRLEFVKILTIFRDFLGSELVPIDASIGPAPGGGDDIAAFAGIAMNPAPRPFMVLAAEAVRRSSSQGNVAAHRAGVLACERLMELLGKEPDIVSDVRHQLSQALGAAPSPRSVAKALNLSERTLRRRLHQYNTSYSRILAEVRLKFAEEFLDEGSLSTDLIAEQLGYTETTNFRHAFRRWTGSSPRRYQAHRLQNLTNDCQPCDAVGSG